MSRRDRSVRSPGVHPRQGTAVAGRTALEDPARGLQGGPRPSDPRVPHPAPLEGIAPWVLLPMRFFFGGMFLYAGLDKLLDPAFLRAEGIGSIGEQLHGFVQVSPLAPFITVFALPFPVLVGAGIALLEIAVGIGTIFGLLYRLAAFGGAALALLFFLTASWDTRPIYLGADLPYLAGWVTLTLAGDGGLLSVDAWLRRRDAQRLATTRSARARGTIPVAAIGEDPEATSRRQFLELGLLTAASLIVAGIAWRSPFRGTLDQAASSTGGATASTGTTGLGLPSPTPSPAATVAGASLTPSPSAAAPGASAPAAGGGTLLGSIDQVPKGQAASFTVPSTGDPGVLVHLQSGDTVAYDALCTHEGCQVDYDSGQAVLFCPCHGAVFDPANGAKVLRGPARRPLPELNVRVDNAGNVYLEA